MDIHNDNIRDGKAQGIVPTEEPLRGDGVMKYIDTGLGQTATT